MVLQWHWEASLTRDVIERKNAENSELHERLHRCESMVRQRSIVQQLEESKRAIGGSILVSSGTVRLGALRATCLARAGRQSRGCVQALADASSVYGSSERTPGRRESPRIPVGEIDKGRAQLVQVLAARQHRKLRFAALAGSAQQIRPQVPTTTRARSSFHADPPRC